MALTATYSTVGFEPVGHLFGHAPNPVKVLLTPNTAFTRGDMVVLTNSKVAAAAQGATNVLGVMARSYTTTENPSAADTYGEVYVDPFIIYRCTFADHTDSTATSGTTTTLVDTALSTSADDNWNGASVYIYEGTNAGILTTVKDYTGSTDTLTFEDVLPAACDTTTKYIMLGVGTENNNIFPFQVGVDLKDANTIDANATCASEGGPLVMMPTPKEEIKNLIMRVMLRKSRLNSV